MADTGSAREMETLEMAAILLMTLGEESAAQILRHMGPKEVQKVGAAMAALDSVRNDQVETVMSAMLAEVESLTGLGVQSDSYIKSTLVKALGADKAGALIDMILMGGNTTGLDTLKWMDAKSVYEIIRREHPQIQAIVLAYLDADHAGQVLSQFVDQEARLEVLMRVATLENVQPAALMELNGILEKQFSGESNQTAFMGGPKVAAEIMNNIEIGEKSGLLDSISAVDETLAGRIADLMFTFDNLASLDNHGIQALLKEITSDTLIVALKGADQALQERVFENMSRRAAELLADDLEVRGPVRVSEVERAQKEILAVARKMAESGDIVLGGNTEEMI